MAEETFNLNAVQGFENYEQDVPKIQYAKIVNAQIAMTDGLPLGAMITSNDKKELVKLGQELQVIIVTMFTDFTIWKDNKLVAKAYTKFGRWSNGMNIEGSHFEFVDNNKPIATEALNFVVIPIIGGVANIKDKCIMSYSSSNFFSKEMGIKSKSEIAKTLTEKKMHSLSQGIYTVKVVTASNKKGTWLTLDSLKFHSIIPDATMLAEASIVFNEVKDISKKRFDETSYHSDAPSEYAEAELVQYADTPLAY